jgi:hypothetical protein
MCGPLNDDEILLVLVALLALIGILAGAYLWWGIP